MLSGNDRAQPRQTSGNRFTKVSTCSAGSNSRCEPRWPVWAPRLRRSALRLLRAARSSRAPEPGPSLDGGRCEFCELRPSSSVRASTCLARASFCLVSASISASRSASAASSATTRLLLASVPASSPLATPSLDHDLIHPSIRLGQKNVGV